MNDKFINFKLNSNLPAGRLGCRQICIVIESGGKVCRQKTGAFTNKKTHYPLLWHRYNPRSKRSPGYA